MARIITFAPVPDEVLQEMIDRDVDMQDIDADDDTHLADADMEYVCGNKPVLKKLLTT